MDVSTVIDTVPKRRHTMQTAKTIAILVAGVAGALVLYDRFVAKG